MPGTTQVLAHLFSLQPQSSHKKFLFKSVNNLIAALPGKHNLNGFVNEKGDIPPDIMSQYHDTLMFQIFVSAKQMRQSVFMPALPKSLFNIFIK